MPRSYFVFVVLFLLTVGAFIVGVATGSGSLLLVAFVSTLVLFFVRRSFLGGR